VLEAIVVDRVGDGGGPVGDVGFLVDWVVAGVSFLLDRVVVGPDLSPTESAAHACRHCVVAAKRKTSPQISLLAVRTHTATVDRVE